MRQPRDCRIRKGRGYRKTFYVYVYEDSIVLGEVWRGSGIYTPKEARKLAKKLNDWADWIDSK